MDSLELEVQLHMIFNFFLEAILIPAITDSIQVSLYHEIKGYIWLKVVYPNLLIQETVLKVM